MAKNTSPPKEGESVYVSHSQIFGKIIEVGEQRGQTQEHSPIYHVILDRNGTCRDALVFRQRNRVYLRKNLGVKGLLFDAKKHS